MINRHVMPSSSNARHRALLAALFAASCLANVQATPPSPPLADREVAPCSDLSFPAGLRVDETNTFKPREPQNEFEVQLALVQRQISPGPLDGVMGPQTRSALLTFQEVSGLPMTGEADSLTRSNLLLQAPPLARYTMTEADLGCLRRLSRTWLGKSQQERLCYETVLELVAERSQANPKLLQRLNPSAPWTNMVAGTELVVPNAAYTPPTEKAAFAKVFLSQRVLQVYDERTNLLAHFPCSIGRQAESRPVGRLEVEVIAEKPNYTFNPQIFPESEEGRRLGRKLMIPPGPNNPVGLVWIGLNRPGYGIHGTPEPEKVGRTESHGCFRLANWNAIYLAKLVWISMPVFVEP
jgi:lipoprotein-anchoring transpeptidase ErfK/SrfK